MSQRYGGSGRHAADDEDWDDPTHPVPNHSNHAPTTVGRPGGMSDDDSENSDYDDLYVDSSKIRRPRASTTNYANNNQQRQENLEPAEQLRLACMNDNLERVQELLDAGSVKVDECSKTTGWSPLMIATSNGNSVLVNLLLDRGANANFRASGSGDELTPLMVSSIASVQIGEILKCVGLLIERGADVNFANNNGLTPLMLAAKEKKLRLVQALLDAGADVNATDRDGRSALELIAGLGFGRIIRVLLEHGADASLINEYGQIAGEVAGERGHQIISDILYRVATTKWRPGLPPELLNDLVDLDSKRIFFVPNKAAEVLECNERSQIEMVLENLKLQDNFKKFQEHKVSYLNFLNLNDEQLKDIGIETVGDRMKIMDAIRDIHNREWVDQSVTPIYLKTDITASEVVCILNNTKKHMEYIGATVQYLRKKSITNPEMVEVGIEQTPLKDMLEYSTACLDAITKLQTDIKLLQDVLRQLEKDSEFQIADNVVESPRHRFIGKWSTMLGAITLAGVGFVMALRCRPQYNLQWAFGFKK